MKKTICVMAVLAAVFFAVSPGVQAKEHGKVCPFAQKYEEGQPRCQMCDMHAGFGRQDKEMDWEKKFFEKAHMIIENEEVLKLTDEQKEKIYDEKYSLKKKLIKLEADIEIAKVDLKRELKKEQVDIKAVNKLIDQKYDAKRQKAKDLVGADEALKGILSEAQYNKVKDLCKSGKM